MKSIEFEIADLYWRGAYDDALRLARVELQHAHPDENKEVYRSMLDTALRCCLKLEDTSVGVEIASMSTERVCLFTVQSLYSANQKCSGKQLLHYVCQPLITIYERINLKARKA